MSLPKKRSASTATNTGGRGSAVRALATPTAALATVATLATALALAAPAAHDCYGLVAWRAAAARGSGRYDHGHSRTPEGVFGGGGVCVWPWHHGSELRLHDVANKRRFLA